MKNYIPIKNEYKTIDFWRGNTMKYFETLDLKQELNSETPILLVQKSAVETIDWILQEIWIKDENVILKDYLLRTGFLKINSKDYWQLVIYGTKWADSTMIASQYLWDYFLWWWDIWEKVWCRGINFQKIAEIASNVMWKYKTELMVLIWANSVNRLIEKWQINRWWLSSFEIDMLATKFKATLTKRAIEELKKINEEFKKTMKIPTIDVVDSNSEMVVQMFENFFSDIIAASIEIVQSWNSLIATNNTVIKDWKLYMPSKRDIITWEFEWEIITEIDLESQIWILSNNIQSEIDMNLYKILNNLWWNKPTEFINVIQESMNRINNY